MRRNPTRFTKEETRQTIALSGEVVVSDPCYSIDKLRNVRIEVKPGDWKCSVTMMSIPGDDHYPSVARLSVRHPEYADAKTDERIGLAIADSGQIGVFDMDYFRENSYISGEERSAKSFEWYTRVCNITRRLDFGVIDGKAFVSLSGFGNVAYGLWVKKDENGDVVAIDVIFIDGEAEPEQKQ